MTLAIAEGILKVAYEQTGYSPKTLRSRTRIAPVARTRQAIMYALRQRTVWSLPQISRFMGLTDHSTSLHACKVTPGRIEADEGVARLVDALLSAPEIPPFSIGVICSDRNDPQEAVRKSRRVTADRNARRRLNAALMQEAVKAPPPAPLEQASYAGRSMQLDERGECHAQRYMRSNMRRGSRLLAEAINALRASA